MTRCAMALFFLSFLSTANAAEYEIVNKNSEGYYVLIDILKNSITEISTETVYKDITRSICKKEPCHVKFWIDSSLVPNQINSLKTREKGVVAIYSLKNDSIKRIYHYNLTVLDETINEIKCLKKVFHVFCLGDDSENLPSPVSKEKKGVIAVYFYPDNTFVSTVQNKVAEVTRIFHNITWLKYQSLLSKLQDKYGVPKDLSYYPSYVNSDEMRSTAIFIGKAKSSYLWEKKGWRVKLSWFEKNAGLFYEHNELHGAKEALELDEGF